MPRVDINLPEHFYCTFQLRIRLEDLNYGGHMANDTIARYCNEARVRFLRRLGYDNEMDIEGLSLILADSATQFKSEGFYRDKIEVSVAITNLSRSSFELYFKFYNKTREELLAISKAGMVFFDYNARKVRSMPDEFRALFT